MQFRKYTKENFILAIAQSNSIRQALTSLGVSPYGGNYKTAKGYIKNLNLDISHMTGKGWRKDRLLGPKKQITNYLDNQTPISSFKLKNRLLKEKIKLHLCENCNLTDWLDKPIPLELHHIDGDSQNNNLSNLQLLCPNCHALTTNYRGRNKANSTI